MKGLFTGYFAPTEAEFKELWKSCIFAFDANVLLGLYRSTTETQQVFVSVLEKIADRIFLPHQAASEYLRNRLKVISIRSDSFGKISSEANRLVNTVESMVQEHALRNGKDLVKIAKDAAKKIHGLVAKTVKEEPDLLRSDELLKQMAELFKASTGEPYGQPRLTELYTEAAQRYSKGIPPGFKDDKKPEPEKYGDALIWFQLLDYAKSKQKPLIFVTGDVKEDWWQQHAGDTLGPRPELRQEMMATAGVAFYMYTVPRFLEFAKQFLNLKVDTREAESEFEKIEKQDKEAAERNEGITTTASSHAVSYKLPAYQMNVGYSAGQPANQWWGGMPDSYGPPMNQWWGEVPSSYISLPKPVDAKRKNKFFSLLPINGYVYQSLTGKWKCEIVSEPVSDEEDHGCYILKFERQDIAMKPRNLKLWVSLGTLEHDVDWRYKTAIARMIKEWLAGPESSGEITCF
jgi:hypothetical protein